MKIDKDRLKVAAISIPVNSLISQPRPGVNSREVANRTLRSKISIVSVQRQAPTAGEIDDQTAEESVRGIMKEPFIQAIIEAGHSPRVVRLG
ncbi:MAG: hypothetical protein IPF99_43710 [Deltaproteobacteria bacterium]|nr:hypothetical protein [Deltaproteobacteria bacterium]